jgi:O-acetyl-ADP-ribose deacetylase (regulator of RNase III)
VDSGVSTFAIHLNGNKVLEFLGPADITRESADAIVNAANSSLMGGGGVDGAIHRNGGPAILEECKRIVARIGRLPAGQAVITTGGRLSAKHVIHTVGPVYRDGKRGEPAVLANCYRESLRVADEQQLESVAFPSISTGAYGYPITEAAEIAVSAVVEGLNSCRHVRKVRFVLFDATTLNAYLRAGQECAKVLDEKKTDRRQLEDVQNTRRHS